MFSYCFSEPTLGFVSISTPIRNIDSAKMISTASQVSWLSDISTIHPSQTPYKDSEPRRYVEHGPHSRNHSTLALTCLRTSVQRQRIRHKNIHIHNHTTLHLAQQLDLQNVYLRSSWHWCQNRPPQPSRKRLLPSRPRRRMPTAHETVPPLPQDRPRRQLARVPRAEQELPELSHGTGTDGAGRDEELGVWRRADGDGRHREGDQEVMDEISAQNSIKDIEEILEARDFAGGRPRRQGSEDEVPESASPDQHNSVRGARPFVRESTGTRTNSPATPSQSPARDDHHLLRNATTATIRGLGYRTRPHLYLIRATSRIERQLYSKTFPAVTI